MTAFQIMKQANAMLVLRLLREEPLSRAELARRTGLTRATITGIADELIEEGLLREGKITRTTVGRHPILLELDPNAYFSVGVDISREGVSISVTDFTLNRVEEQCFSADLSKKDVLEKLCEFVKKQASCRRILGVGVVAPGPLDTARGCVLTPRGMDAWHGFSVGELEERLSLPVLLEKDSAALAIAEKRYVGARASFLSLLADHGLGAGFIYNGHRFGSPEGYGCEIGHVSMDANGPLCSCGNRGCAELYASIPAILSHARSCGRELSWQELLAGAESGDSFCLDLLSRQAEALALACIGAVNMLEPERILLEGKLSAAHAFVAEHMEKAFATRCFTQNGRRVRVEPSSLPSGARAIAAAALPIEHFFEG